MYKTGDVVHSVAGHDKHRFYVVVNATLDSVWIADGKLRKLDKPKRKNVLHVKKTLRTLDLEVVNTDKKLRQVLGPLNERARAAMQEEGG